MAEEPTTTGVTLTQATHVGRLAVKYGAISLVVLMVGRIFLGAAVAFWRSINPPPPPPPTVGFGTLPAISFPDQDADDKPVSYRLETASGTTPNFGDRAKVFLMLKSTPSLLADQRAREMAARYDFVFEPEVVNSTTYVWRKTAPLNFTLEMNIFNEDIELTSDYASRGDLLINAELPDDFTAVTVVKNFLKAGDLLPPDVATAAGEVVYLKSLGGELAPAVSLSDADYIQVDLNRTPIDNLFRMYGPNGYDGSIHAIVSGSFKNRDAVVELTSTYQPVDYDQVHTYPIRTSQQAWNVLKSGEGYVADPGEAETAVVRQVSLGYFDSAVEQDYLQPIFVFEGDDGFLGYVSALDPQYIQ